MSRVRTAVFLAAAVSLAVLATVGAGDGPAAMATAAPPTTTVAAPASVPAGEPPLGTVAGQTGSAPTSTIATSPRTQVNAPTRGGASAGSLAKPEDEAWSVRQMVTTTALCVVALAAAGFVYGRIRSTPPRHPDLVRSGE